MKATFALLLTGLLVTACSKKEEEASTAPDTKETPTTKASDKEPPAAKQGETKPPETKPPETKPPETKPPETKPPETKVAEVKAPFDFKIAPKSMPYKAGDFIWASYPLNKTGGWGYNKVRFGAAKGDWAEVKTLATFVTHSAFLHNPPPPDAGALKEGTPVKAHVGVGVKYGRVQAVNGDKVKVKFYVSGPKSGERELPLSSVELWTEPTLAPGTPVIYADGEMKKLATLLHKEGDKVYIAGRKGIVELEASAVTPIDPSKTFKRGAKVWAYARKGLGSYKMTEGKITKVHDKGVWYEWKASEGKQIAKVSFAKVLAK